MKKKIMPNIIHILLTIIVSFQLLTGKAQQGMKDNLAYDYRKIYSSCLDADVNKALVILSDTSKQLSDKDREFKNAFELRFKYETDQSDFIVSKKSSIDDLLRYFQSYWRTSLLHSEINNDSLFINGLYLFFKNNYPAAKNLILDNDSIDIYLKKYLSDRSLYTTGLGKTGRLYDLLVWSSEKDTTYTFKAFNETTSSRVILMQNFITLGWEEYATLGRFYPGGWATKEALYCVTKAYDMSSELFRISYLAHESRHFADYKLFPKLKSTDLEYRAKLMELSLAQTTLYNLIEFFIINSNYDSENGHQVANYCVIRDLSKIIFKTNFENDINKWKQIDAAKINQAAHQVLEANTKELKKKGKDVERFVKTQ